MSNATVSRLAELRARVRGIVFGRIDLCQCCTLVVANGECCADDQHGGDGIEPLSALDGRFHVSLGLTADEHSEYCDREADGECDCDREEFATSRCDGCGSYLAGSRYAATLFREPQHFTRPVLPA